MSPEKILVRTLCVGVCGTDTEILAGHYGRSPAGRARLILGHEAIGVVITADSAGSFALGEHVVPIVRRPDPIPCTSCAVGEFDMCRNGAYTEHGIKELDGFCTERFAADAAELVRVDSTLGTLGVLVEPTSIVVKAWQNIMRIGGRAHFCPETVVITGAGPIGLLAMLVARHHGLRTFVFDQAESGPKPAAVNALGGEYYNGNLAKLLEKVQPDIVVECTGASSVVLEVIQHNGRSGIVCLVGVSSSGPKVPVDVGSLNRSIVLENDVVFGSVNANRSHYESAVEILRQADPDWLRRVISRRVPFDDWRRAFERTENDIKVVIDLSCDK